MVIVSDQEKSAVDALRRGDVRGLKALVQSYQLQAVRVAFGVVGDREIAEDAVSDAFILVYERIAQYDDERPFAPWFYRIVVNCALKAARGKSKVVEVREDWNSQDDDSWQNEQISELPGPELIAEQNELRELVIGVLDGLPAVQRAVVVLRYYLDMDEASIADLLGCPLGTVKWRLHAAKAKLREMLNGKL